MVDDPVSRRSLKAQAQEMSYLYAGEGSPLLLLHGTYWSRVWLPVIPRLAQDNAVLAADARYTMELVEPLRRSGSPILLVWGEEDSAQPIGYARRFAREFPQAHLVAVPGAGYIPMEDDPETVGATLAGFFAEA